MAEDTLIYGIKPDVWHQILGALHSNAAIESVILFGSRAKGTARNGSDIDLCLKGKQLSHSDIIDLLVKLDELDLPWKIDLIGYERINEPALLEHIDRVGIELLPDMKSNPSLTHG